MGRGEMEDDFCDWYMGLDTMKIESSVDILNQARVIGAKPWFSCSSDRKTQSILVGYIGCIPLNQIDIQEEWNPSRKESIKQWGTKERLSRVLYKDTSKQNYQIDPSSIPSLSRSYEYNKNPPLFDIGDGIHRINRAKELGMQCIIADVVDEVKIKKSKMV